MLRIGKMKEKEEKKTNMKLTNGLIELEGMDILHPNNVKLIYLH